MWTRSAVSWLCFLAVSRTSSGHGFLAFPPLRGGTAGSAANAYCPQCGNGAGICGDGGQWGASSDFLGHTAGPSTTLVAGDVLEVTIKITAHHRGHFEFSICDQPLGHSTVDAQGCLDRRRLRRAPPPADCVVNDARGDCQPVHEDYPERWYLPPTAGAHTIRLQIPADLECATCTLQWRWWTANSCIPAPDYGCYFDRMRELGWNTQQWCGGSCGGCGSSLFLQLPRCSAGQGEEFRNCADIEVVGSGAATSTASAATTPDPSTTSAPATSSSPEGTTGSSASPRCVSREAMVCINDYSQYWPKCSPEQTKTNAGPSGYEFGHYCDESWANALNEMLADPAIDKCGDEDAIHNLLAQVTYETGYFSTVYQPIDGGAGLIHMIPANWPVNARDMDDIWPGQDFEAQAATMGKNFFQTPAYGWRSVAAWFKRTNRVIGTCGVDLFEQSFDRQTECILGRASDRSEAYEVVRRCLEQHPVGSSSPTTSQTTEASSTTPSSTTDATTAATTSAPPSTPASTESSSTAASGTTPQSTTSSSAPTTAPPTTAQSSSTTAGTGSCVRNEDCSANAWCLDTTYTWWCPTQGQQGWCPFPQCVQGGSGTGTPAPSSSQSPTTTPTETPTTSSTSTPCPTTPAPSTTSPTTSTPATTVASSTSGASSCERNLECEGNAWCAQESFATWCPTQGAHGWCPSPMCVQVGGGAR